MSSRRKSGEDGAAVVGVLLCGAAILPFLLYAPIHRMILLSRLNNTAVAQQIFDMGMVWRTIQRRAVAIGATAIVLFIGGALLQNGDSAAPHSLIYLVVSSLLLVVVGICAGIAVAVSSVGVFVDPGRDIALFPTDGVPRSFEDVLRIRWLLGGLTMQSIELSKIASLTRQAGTLLLVHGPFGSHRLEFSSKLKRDDCISTLRQGAAAVGNRIRVSW